MPEVGAGSVCGSLLGRGYQKAGAEGSLFRIARSPVAGTSPLATFATSSRNAWLISVVVVRLLIAICVGIVVGWISQFSSPCARRDGHVAAAVEGAKVGMKGER